MNIGVYKITNKINGKIYIGSTIEDFEQRWYNHKIGLKGNYHDNPYLQNAWNKYGEENFIFEIVEKCEKDSCRKREQIYLDLYFPWKRINGYNICKSAGTWLGMKHSEETKEKLRKIMTGKKQTEETKKKISINNTRPMLGKYHSEETKKIISQKRLGKKYPRSIEQIKNTQKNIKSIKPVEAIKCDTGEVIEFDCIHDAVRVGFLKSCIQFCLNGKNTQHKGYFWQLLRDRK